MGRLNLSSGLPNFSKAIFSIWFRVPQASINANSFIQLMTYGQVQTFTDVEPHFVNAITPANTPATTDYFATADRYDVISRSELDPCYIGLTCTAGVAKLVFNMQMANLAMESGIAIFPGPCQGYRFGGLPTSTSAGFNPAPGTGWQQQGTNPTDCHFTGLTDLTSEYNVTPDGFIVQSPVHISGDTWHHLLLSFDLSTDCRTHTPPNSNDGNSSQNATTAAGTDSYCKLWYAIDDVNYNGAANLAPYFVDGGSDPNAILTGKTHACANFSVGATGNLFEPQAFSTFPASLIPSSGAALGIPGTARDISFIYDIEMSRPFQVFTGISLDTSVEANRRLFIDANRHPVPSSVASAALGTPVVLFNKNKDWKNGTNKGSAGRFTPTGSINDFSPGPEG